MTTYKYKGQSLSGARVSGVVRAYDEFEAVAKLRDTCAFITKIEPVKERGNALDKPIGFRLKDKLGHHGTPGAFDPASWPQAFP